MTRQLPSPPSWVVQHFRRKIMGHWVTVATPSLLRPSQSTLPYTHPMLVRPGSGLVTDIMISDASLFIYYQDQDPQRPCCRAKSTTSLSWIRIRPNIRSLRAKLEKSRKNASVAFAVCKYRTTSRSWSGFGNPRRPSNPSQILSDYSLERIALPPRSANRIPRCLGVFRLLRGYKTRRAAFSRTQQLDAIQRTLLPYTSS